MAILRELWSDEVNNEQVLSTYQYVIAKSRKFEVGDKVLLLLPTESNKMLLQWKGPYEIIEVINRMDYKVDVNGVVNPYHANMLKQYVERQNVASHCLMSAEATASVNADDDTEEFSLDDCAFPTAKQPESYNDVSISDTDQIQHDIKLFTSEPIRSTGYPIPFKTRDVMEAEIQEMIDLDVIEPSISQYSSPVGLVSKKDGSVRFCIDFRKVNKVTEFDAESMPNMEEVIIKMSGHKFFTKMDLSKGYWQVSLSERSKPLTAFETPRGLFEFKTMPFGLVNSGATFCRLMRIILSKLRVLTVS